MIDNYDMDKQETFYDTHPAEQHIAYIFSIYSIRKNKIIFHCA